MTDLAVDDVAPGITSSFDGSVLYLDARTARTRATRCASRTVSALLEQIEAVDGGDAVRAILIRAEGRHFCLGADLVSANAGTGKPRPGHLTRSLDAGRAPADRRVVEQPRADGQRGAWSRDGAGTAPGRGV